MQFQYFDIHSHLNLSPLFEQKGEILARMRELGVGTITVGTGIGTSRDAIRIADENPDVCYATVGVHPCDAPDHVITENDWVEIENLARNPRVVAIGETGLDYFRLKNEDLGLMNKEKEEQKKIFQKHIEIAVSVGKPLMLHVRAAKGTDDAYYDALEILKDQSVKANFHFFSGSKECMEKIVAAGFTISVDGPITFSHDYDDMIRTCPIESIMAETDAPYAAPMPYRGKTCEPWMVVEVVKKIAELKLLPLETVQKQLLENAQKFFTIPELDNK
ncbi:MAG: TatD family hydrolase [Candidatus Pacebacteria bacterium]|nr:TatD family hydrolase [Candidatus Paceibacterota bacterium]